MLLSVVVRAVSVISLLVLFACFAAGQRLSRRLDDYGTTITANSFGPNEADVEREKLRAVRSREVGRYLRGSVYRVVNFVTADVNERKLFRVYFYDYTNDRVVIAAGEFGSTARLTVHTEDSYPGVANGERLDAIQVVKADKQIEAMYGSDNIRVTDAMPRVTDLDGQRLVNIGISYPDGRFEVVGISFRDRSIVHYDGGAPPTSRAAVEACGITPAGQEVSYNGDPGEYHVTISQGGTTLWDMNVVRPAASSGNPGERSGIEIQNVTYRGKSVMKRGNAPVLNVKYGENNICGPYRDWKYEEGMFDAPSVGALDVAPGFRVLAPGQVATTSLESGNDTGNFLGVAVYRSGTETVMVSEMEAGWYRYIMEWRFDDDGTIRPRFGFGATEDPCVCHTHYHHVYWRFDFDVVNTANEVIQREGNRTPSQTITTENAVFRKDGPRQHRNFLIKNSTGPEGYILTPGLTDGLWNADGSGFGMGDFWILRFHGTASSPDELDDPNFGLPDETPAQIGAWLNNESVFDQDVVIWYAGHFTHAHDGESLLDPDHRYPDTLSGDHVVGPDLRPINW